MTDTEVLLAAADLIERNGLHKGDYWPGAVDGDKYKPGDPCDVLGAFQVVSGASMSLAVEGKLTNALHYPVGPWSDAASQAEVVATLRAVATSEET